MAKQTKQNSFKPLIDQINYLLSHMTIKDMKRNCIIRGMDWDLLIVSDINKLQSWLYHNWDNTQNTKLLDEFDEWFENKLKEAGTDDSLIHPMLRLGYIAETDDDGNITKQKRIKGMKKGRKKEKRTKNEFGIFSGTKKSVTFESQKQGYSLKDTIDIIFDTFPGDDIATKSIQIWYNKARKLNGDLSGKKIYEKKRIITKPILAEHARLAAISR